MREGRNEGRGEGMKEGRKHGQKEGKKERRKDKGRKEGCVCFVNVYVVCFLVLFEEILSRFHNLSALKAFL